MKSDASIRADDLVGMTARLRGLNENIDRGRKMRAARLQTFDQLVQERESLAFGAPDHQIDAKLEAIVAQVVALDATLAELLQEMADQAKHFAGVSIV